jgi:hypothetical protein
VTWDVIFHMDVRGDLRVPCGPFTYLEESLTRNTAQRFFICGEFERPHVDPTYPTASPIPAIVTELVVHTHAERRLFLDNIVTMLELMEAQRDVDRN